MISLLALTMPDPEAFSVFGHPIRWYGICVALGFILGMTAMRRRAKPLGVDPDRATDIVIYALVGGILGARLMYVATHDPGLYLANPLRILKLTEGGLVFYGGLIGGTLSVLLGTWVMKLNVWLVADLIAIGLPIGEALGRVGCLLNGCCYGAPTKGFFAVHYPASSGIEGGVIPSQFTDSLYNIVTFAVLWFLAPRIKPSGRLFGIMLMSYSVCRFLNEFLRGDYPADQLYHGMTPAQLISLPLLVIGIAIFIWRSPGRNPHPPAAAATPVAA